MGLPRLTNDIFGEEITNRRAYLPVKIYTQLKRSTHIITPQTRPTSEPATLIGNNGKELSILHSLQDKRSESICL